MKLKLILLFSFFTILQTQAQCSITITGDYANEIQEELDEYEEKKKFKGSKIKNKAKIVKNKVKNNLYKPIKGKYSVKVKLPKEQELRTAILMACEYYALFDCTVSFGSAGVLMGIIAVPMFLSSHFVDFAISLGIGSLSFILCSLVMVGATVGCYRKMRFPVVLIVTDAKGNETMVTKKVLADEDMPKLLRAVAKFIYQTIEEMEIEKE